MKGFFMVEKIKVYFIKCIISTLLVFLFSINLSALEVKRNKQNLIDDRLFGKWEFSDEINKFLQGDSRIKTIKFINNKSIISKIPEKFLQKLKNIQIYSAGFMIILGIKFPFILINLHGNMNVVFFKNKDNHPYENAESVIITLVRGKEKKNDLLFVGGDFVNEPFSAYTRAE
jgi:hypothetical protein